MKFTFTDKKVNIPNRVHTYAEKKIGKLDRYFQTEPEASIVFSVEKGRNNLEVTRINPVWKSACAKKPSRFPTTPTSSPKATSTRKPLTRSSAPSVSSSAP